MIVNECELLLLRLRGIPSDCYCDCACERLRMIVRDCDCE